MDTIYAAAPRRNIIHKRSGGEKDCSQYQFRQKDAKVTSAKPFALSCMMGRKSWGRFAVYMIGGLNSNLRTHPHIYCPPKGKRAENLRSRPKAVHKRPHLDRTATAVLGHMEVTVSQAMCLLGKPLPCCSSFRFYLSKPASSGYGSRPAVIDETVGEGAPNCLFSMSVFINFVCIGYGCKVRWVHWID